MTIASEFFTNEERSLLTRHKSPDLTPRETLLQIELQTRVQVLRIADATVREARLADCAALKADLMALDFNNDGMEKINSAVQRGMELHRSVVGAVSL
jgi:hypothetical protein